MGEAHQTNRIGKYRLIASLGQGGMARVYLAVVPGPAGFQKLLVVKALRDDLPEPDGYVAMFLDEARLAARLNHPNVVQTYEVGEADGRYFIAMEYLDGQSLRMVQRRLGKGGLPLEASLRVLAETARGLHHAHDLCDFDGKALQVVHRDVSPHNIFLSYAGEVKLLDFGIAKDQQSEHVTRVGLIKGKADYMAPEQVRGVALDRRADVFALGVMLWEMLAGASYTGPGKIEDVTKLHNRVAGNETPIRKAAPEAPEALLSLCERSLRLQPEERIGTALEFADALEAHLRSVDAHPSAVELGQQLQEAFAPEREALRRTIEEHTRSMSSLGETADPAGQDGLGPESGTGSLPRFSAPQARTSSLMLEHREVQAPGSLPPALHPDPPPTRIEARGTRLIAGIALLVAIGTAAALLSRDTNASSGPEAPRTTARTARATVPDRTPADAPEQETVSLRVTVEPEDASVSLDGVPLPGPPFEAELIRGESIHRVEVSREGYRTVTRSMAARNHGSLQVALERERRRARRRARRVTSAVTRTAAPPTGGGPATAPTPAREDTGAPRAPAAIRPGDDLEVMDKKSPRTPVTIDMEDPYL